eukprot:TRINITY_DN26142_c0_g1_i1.p1 TRINITY_DN26142_c0_g1~~TRINITY_DN26142_c0_g1_i1.p1  ORF type:complete len:315 (-),score=61.19 TRINITY_DN26142_c0_g1_i1:117-1061(-)
MNVGSALLRPSLMAMSPTSPTLSSPSQSPKNDRLSDAEAVEAMGAFGCGNDGAGLGNTGEYNPRLTHKLAALSCYWSGNIFRDYIFHVFNRHSVLSVFFAHPANPYTKVERFGLLVIMTLLTFAASTFLVWIQRRLEAQFTCESTLCDFIRDGHGGTLMQQGVICVFVTMPIMALTEVTITFFKLKVRLLDFKERPFWRCICGCVLYYHNKCEACLGVIGLWTALVLIMIDCFLVSLSKGDMDEIVVSFVISRIQAWTMWFGIDMFMPKIWPVYGGGYLSRWFREKRERSELGLDDDLEEGDSEDDDVSVGEGR